MRRGISLIELLTAIGIIGVLLALTAPAISAARESARKMQCKNNLHQIGIALHNYHDAEGCFPVRDWFGYHLPLLPWLDYRSIHDRFIDQTAMTIDTGQFQKMKVPTFLCPSDSFSARAHVGMLNYACNAGTGWVYGKNGFVIDLQPVRFSDLRDGASNTAAQSEILYTDNASLQRLRTVWFVSPPMRTPAQWPAFLEACEALPETVSHASTDVRGLCWFNGETYDHARPPQHRKCENGRQGSETGVFPAASAHVAGAHVLMCDGRVRFVSENIDGHIWEAIGTRNSGDALSSEF